MTFINTIKCFDAHFHIIDDQYPLTPNNGYLPDKFCAEDYKSEIKKLNLNIAGGAIVSGSFQGFDQEYLKNALKILGDGYIGVTNLSHDCSDQEILLLNKAGVRAVRFNLYRGGSENINNLINLAQRVYDLAKWHVELYLDSKNLKEITGVLLKCPKISIDHLGMSQEGLDDLLYLVEKGANVKATGFARINLEPVSAMKQIYKINPEALMFGTDLPGTRAPRVFNQEDIGILEDNFSKEQLENIMFNNALKLYNL